MLVGLGVLLVRGLRSGDAAGLAFGLGIASVIAAYTLVDKHGVEYAEPVVYLELGMVPAALGYLAFALRSSLGQGSRARSRAPGPGERRA